MAVNWTRSNFQGTTCLLSQMWDACPVMWAHTHTHTNTCTHTHVQNVQSQNKLEVRVQRVQRRKICVF